MGRGHEQSDDAVAELETETTELLRLPTSSRMSRLALVRHSPFTLPSPPWDARASVPFRWEEIPGKPKASRASSPEPFPCTCPKLPPPPRLFGANMVNVGFMHSPMAVLHRTYTNCSFPFSSSFSSEGQYGCGSSKVAGAGDAGFSSHGGSGGDYSLELSGKLRIPGIRRRWRLSRILPGRSHSWGSITRGFRKVVLRKRTPRYVTVRSPQHLRTCQSCTRE